MAKAARMPGVATDRQYDVVLFGATGFTGGLTAEYLARQRARGTALGPGRAQPRPSSRRSATGSRPSARAPVPTCSRPTPPTAPALAAQVAGAPASSSPPSARTSLYGEPLVAACAAAGTDYVDLTGEPEFVDRMWI